MLALRGDPAARLGLDGKYRTVRGGQVRGAVPRCAGCLASSLKAGRHAVWRGQVLAVHPSSVLYTEKQPPYVVYNDVMLTSENFMRDLSGIEPQYGSPADSYATGAADPRVLRHGGAAGSRTWPRTTTSLARLRSTWPASGPSPRRHECGRGEG